MTIDLNKNEAEIKNLSLYVLQHEVNLNVENR